MFAIIACIDQKRGLGYRGKLLFHLKTDLKFFKNTTLGHPVMMGRKTWESLPHKLPGRQNIVVSRSMEAPGKLRATPVTTKAPNFLRPTHVSDHNSTTSTPVNNSAAFSDNPATPDLVISDFPTFLSEHVSDPETYFIIGGASLYEQALPYADTLYLTEVAATRPADTFFPKFDPESYAKTLIEKGSENGLNFTIFRYRKINN